MHVLGLVLVAYWREDRVDCSPNKKILILKLVSILLVYFLGS